jgi:hypothetical protein
MAVMMQAFFWDCPREASQGYQWRNRLRMATIAAIAGRCLNAVAGLHSLCPCPVDSRAYRQLLIYLPQQN